MNLEDPESVVVVDNPQEFVRRDSTFPVKRVNSTIPWGIISDLPKIAIAGKTPTIKTITYSAGQDRRNLVSGDKLLIDVQFSSPVVLFRGPPVLIANAGSHTYNEALYIAGNESETLTFEYVVRPGDGSSPVSCTMLCVASGCLEGASNEGYIQQKSASPIANADLVFPKMIHCKFYFQHLLLHIIVSF